MNAEGARLIATLGLVPHPEGGYYRETFRSSVRMATPRGERVALTAIDFLLPGGAVSTWHRLASDETWHFARGTPVQIHRIARDGTYDRVRLGPDGPWQTTLAAGTWFAAHVPDVTGFALVGCVVAPGFDFADFEIAERDALVAAFPQHWATIERFAR